MKNKKALIGLGVLAVGVVGYLLYKRAQKKKRIAAEQQKCVAQGGTWAEKGKNKWVCENIPQK